MHPFALVGPLGWSELLIIFFIILIIFGPRKLPEVAEALGKSIQKFKKASRDVQKELRADVNDDDEDGKKNLKG
jgi:sec-independent protein translocase protein TatA